MKKSLAEQIERYLKVLIERSDDKRIEIQRTELAETFGCVPSQVTYVINTRFTEKEGYITESYRGGKGFVRISRYKYENGYNNGNKELMNFIDQLLREKLITVSQGELLRHIITNVLKDMPSDKKDNFNKKFKIILADYVRTK
ncbi:MAG: CtsR family transcriptional regulator [Syntrophomonadaceae bacterium]|jgi:transcriptional regulator CtsR